MPINPSSGILQIPEAEVRLFVPFGAKESRVSLGVLNSGSQVATIVGTGWSFPENDDENESPTSYEASLDTILRQPIPIPPGATARVIIPIVIDEEFTSEPRSSGRLRLFSQHESEFADCVISVKLLPEVTIRPDKFTVKKPGVTSFECVLTSEAELPDIAAAKSQHIRWEVKRSGPSKFQLSGRYQTPGHFLRSAVTDTLEVSFEGVEHTLVHPLSISLERCAEPELKVIGEPALEINAGRSRIYFVSITNLGAEELKIHEVTPIAAEDAGVVLPDHGLKGVRIASMTSVSFPMLVRASSRAQPGMVLDVGVSVASNSESRPEAELRVGVSAMRYRPSSTPIGFDFGTINSCVAHIDETLGDSQLLRVPVEIESGKFTQQDIFPSMLHIESLPEGSDEFHPCLWLVTTRKDTFNLAEVKSAFCRGQSVRLRYSDGPERELDSGQCISQFLAYVLGCAEHELARSFRDCVITVPTKYGARTVEQMREVVQRIGVPAEGVHVYDESTNAAVFYIRRGRNSEFLQPYDLPESYSVVIMDVGGGTTDVSILDVTDDDAGKRRRLDVTLRGTTGRIRFGGTHFNTRVKDRWFADYAEACAHQGVPLVPKDELELEGRQQLLVPEGQLTDAIEGSKRKLGAALDQPYERIDRALQSYSFLARDYPPSKIIDLEELPADIIGLTQRRLHELLGKDLNDIISEVQLMARSLTKHPLGVVLLVGQSSQLDTIRKTVTKAFGEDKVCLVPAETAKSCVVQGALELHQLLRNPGGIEFTFRDLSHVLSCRIGMLWSGRYEMEFKELLPIGSNLPAEAVCTLPVQGELSKESFRITLLANYGAKDAIKGNENIVRLGTYSLPQNMSLAESFEIKIIVGENGDLVPSVSTSDGLMEMHAEI